MSFTAVSAQSLTSGRTWPRAPLIVVALVVASATLHLIWPLSEDPSWLLTVCERMLAGQKLYSEISELNPPMSPWLYMPWAWLAPRLGIAADSLTVIAAILVCLGAIAAADRILASAGLLRNRGAWWGVATAALLVGPVLSFAQREHFAAAFVLPMLAAMAARASGKPVSVWLAVVAGLCGGLTMAIKPHFGLALLLPALYVVAARRSLRPVVAIECIVAGLIFTIYLLAFVSLYPDYFTDMLPVATAVYLPNRKPVDVLLMRHFALLAGLCVVVWQLRGDFRHEALSKLLLAATLGFFIAYLVQGRGYTYHLLPAVTLASIGFGLSLFGQSSGHETLARRALLNCLAALAGSLLTLTAVDNVREREQDELPFIRSAIVALRPFGSQAKMALLSDQITVGSPLHRLADAKLINSGPALWIAGNAFEYCGKSQDEEAQRSCDRAFALERKMLREDLTRNPPDVVLSDLAGRDWLAWAREDPQTAALLEPFRPYALIEQGVYKVEILARDVAMPNLRPSILSNP